MEIHFPENSFSDDITIDFTLPSFANIIDEDQKVTFGKDIISAVKFNVVVEGKVVSPYYFDKSIEVTIPYKEELLENLGITPQYLGMFFVKSSGELDVEGITDCIVDAIAHKVTAKVTHFSDIAVAVKSALTAIEEKKEPVEFTLLQNYPNPFNMETTIPYEIPVESYVKITIYNVLGQHVKILVNDVKSSGSYSVIWDGTNEEGIQMNNGLYFYNFQAGNYRQTRKMMLLK